MGIVNLKTASLESKIWIGCWKKINDNTELNIILPHVHGCAHF